MTMNSNVSINDDALTFGVAYTGKGGDCQLGWEDKIIQSVVAGKQAAIAAVIDDIKAHQAKLDELKKHSDSLTKMIGEIERGS
jgi:flagellar basal body rod protein FlgF